MRKLNLGCGGNILDGWENHDMDLDITKPLPYDGNSIDFIFIVRYRSYMHIGHVIVLVYF